MVKIKITSEKVVDRDIMEIKGTNPLQFTEYKNGEGRRVVAQRVPNTRSYCVFALAKSKRDFDRTIKCTKSRKSAENVARDYALKNL